MTYMYAPGVGFTVKPRIYLAGKISKNDWRHTLVPALRGHRHEDGHIEMLDHVYTGPFFVGCDHGCYHGPNTHGAMARQDAGLKRRQIQVIDRCLDGVRQCDVLLAYITAPDAYGTLCEIELALQTGKHVVLVFAPGIDDRDYWFLTARAHGVNTGITLGMLPGVLANVLGAYSVALCGQ